jgi:hypothetical protein
MSGARKRRSFSPITIPADTILLFIFAKVVNLTVENRLPTQADGAARSEFDRPARSPAPGAPAISAPPPTLPSKTPTRPQLLLNSAVLDRLGALAIYLRS